VDEQIVVLRLDGCHVAGIGWFRLRREDDGNH
jgi:hypothetical protein